MPPTSEVARLSRWGGTVRRTMFRLVGVFVRPQEWVLAYFAIVVIGLAAAFGWSLRSLAAVAVAAIAVALAQWRLARTGIDLWRGLCLTAAWNPTGEVWVGQLIVMPRLLLCTLYAFVVVFVGLPLPLAWTRSAWLARLWIDPAARFRR